MAKSPDGRARIAASNRRRAGTYSTACAEGCECGRHNLEMRAKRAAAQVGRKDSAETRQRKSDAAREQHWLNREEYLDETVRAYNEVVPAPYVARVEGLEELRAVRDRLGIQPLSAATYRKYGLTEQEWLELLQEQGWQCPVCLRRVRRFVTDHQHIAGWKSMPPEDRKRYVRGLLCVYDNYRVVHSTMTAREARHIALYIAAYEARRDA